MKDPGGSLPVTSPQQNSKIKKFAGHSGRKLSIASPPESGEKEGGRERGRDNENDNDNENGGGENESKDDDKKDNKDNKDISGIGNGKDSNTKSARTIDEHTDINELEKMLDNDAVALSNMKRDLADEHKNEIKKFNESLTLLKRDFDLIRTLNDVKEKSLLELGGKIKMLLGTFLTILYSVLYFLYSFVLIYLILFCIDLFCFVSFGSFYFHLFSTQHLFVFYCFFVNKLNP